MTTVLSDREPVRLGGWFAFAVGLALNAVLGWAMELDLKTIVITVTTMALTNIGGLEFARSRSFSRVGNEQATAEAAMEIYRLMNRDSAVTSGGGVDGPEGEPEG